MKRFFSFLILFAVVAAFLAPVGAEVVVGESAILSSPVDDDAYLAGGKVLVNEPISGDAAVAGGSLILNAAVGEDLLVAGGSLVINGDVGDDLRGAGGDITVSGNVADDLIVAGGNILIGKNVTVGGDLIAAAGQVILEGRVEGNLKVAGGKIVLRGAVGGDADLRCAEELLIDGAISGRTVFAAGSAKIGPGAAFAGEVRYWQRGGELDFGPAALQGARFTDSLRLPGRGEMPRISGKGAAAGILVSWMALSLLSGALLLLLLVLLSLRYFELAGERLAEGFWRHAGIGFLYFIVTPCVALILAISVVGLPLGLFLIALYVFSLVFASPLSALVFARWLERKRSSSWGKAALFFAGFAILFMLKVLCVIPLAGWLALALLVCAAYGSLLSAKWSIARG